MLLENELSKKTPNLKVWSEIFLVGSRNLTILSVDRQSKLTF
ncbi:hypothetical protein CKA32_002901 [Geitlerinema sp. FC II]|nr:hypothetical protein CKA32_002901 [Geitlerinema sp. FC II]